MAMVFDKWRVNFTFVDGAGDTTTRRHDLVATETQFAEAETAAEALATGYGTVSDAVIVGYQVEKVTVNDAVVLPAVTVHVEDIASITMSIAGHPNKSANISIPAPDLGIFSGVSGPLANQVDAADAGLIAFLALFNAAGSAYVSDGEHTALFKKGKRAKVGTTSG